MPAAPGLLLNGEKPMAIEEPTADRTGDLLSELAALQGYLQAARADLAHLRGASADDRGIQGATDELDAVVLATEQATGTILDSAEALMDLTGSLDGKNGETIQGHVMAIFEACNFQDITGQRIGKVVSVLRHVEERIDGLLAAHPEAGSGAVTPPRGGGRTGDAALLNGPARPDDASSVDQDEIDRLLSGD